MYACVRVCSVALVMSNSLPPHGLQPSRLLCARDFAGRNSGVGSHSLFQGIFLTQGWNLILLYFLHCRQILYPWASREALIIYAPDQNSSGKMGHTQLEILVSSVRCWSLPPLPNYYTLRGNVLLATVDYPSTSLLWQHFAKTKTWPSSANEWLPVMLGLRLREG